ncbi:hypothetical protein MGI18_23295 [Bacillus sp. OVS6]|nr:hypothetical protein MGI18_23295 [Bacillus sp. OVS6]
MLAFFSAYQDETVQSHIQSEFVKLHIHLYENCKTANDNRQIKDWCGINGHNISAAFIGDNPVPSWDFYHNIFCEKLG